VYLYLLSTNILSIVVEEEWLIRVGNWTVPIRLYMSRICSISDFLVLIPEKLILKSPHIINFNFG
jgi:hypothetical protein